MRDVREPLRLEEPRESDGARPADAGEIVAPEIDEHDVLRAVLLGVEQPLGVPVARARGAGDRVQRGPTPFRLDERLRRGTDEREAVELEQEQVRRRIDPAQRAVELERARRGGPLGALGEDDLEGVPRADVLLGLDDRALVFVSRRQAPRRARTPLLPCGRVGQRPLEQVGDLARVAREHLGHPQPVVEPDECLGDDEAALRELAARARQRHRRLQRRRVVVAEIADDRQSAGFSLGEVDEARAAADE